MSAPEDPSVRDSRSDPFETSGPAWWGFHRPEGGSRSIAELIAERTLDAELAGTIWLLLEARVPLVVAAGPPLAGKTTLLTALLDLLPPDLDRVALRGAAEDFAWLPEADELGWDPAQMDASAAAWLRGAFASSGLGDVPARRQVRPGRAYLLAPELSAHLPVYTWGLAARTAVRAVARGYGLGTTVHGDSLEDVLSQLGGPDVRLSEDELSHLGVVVVLRVTPGAGGAPRRRVVAAHYLRPLMRDAGGHLQRLGPAVLATWDERTDAFEHFEWGVGAELSGRTGRRVGDFERERERRALFLESLVVGGVRDRSDVRAAVAGYRSADPVEPDASDVPAAPRPEDRTATDRPA